jgi:hypothetical protein
MNKSILEYASIVPPHMGKTSTADGKIGRYVKEEGRIVGELRLVRGWNGIGQSVGHISHHCFVADKKLHRVSKT